MKWWFMAMLSRFVAAASMVLFASYVCAESPSVDVEAPWARQMSAYGLFADPSLQTPAKGVVPYEIITPLFTDYAEKHRFVYLPEGTAAEYRDKGAFSFPVGTVLVKTFSYPADMRDPEKGRRLVETRLLMHRPDGWDGAAYVWNDEQTDARLAVAGKRVPVSWVHSDGSERSTDYLVPNMNQCKYCHGATGTVGPLGPKAQQLNLSLLTNEGVRHQLTHWEALGILRGAPDPTTVPHFSAPHDEIASLHERALAYLDVNCAHCHNPNGLASGTRLDLRYEQHEPWLRGVLKAPTAAGWASADKKFAIVPGHPEESFLLSRINSDEPNIRMPEQGRTVIHEEGVKLIRAWIEAMPPVGDVTLGGD